eukprot:jgi/Botrbrau1/10975/Bobra.0383s0029.1
MLPWPAPANHPGPFLLAKNCKYGKCSLICFILALVYLERLAKKDDRFRLESSNAHRLILTSILLATKLTDDDYFNNAHFAKVGGIPAAELNKLELEMLKLLDFRLVVSLEELAAMISTLSAEPGLRVIQGQQLYVMSLPEQPPSCRSGITDAAGVCTSTEPAPASAVRRRSTFVDPDVRDRCHLDGCKKPSTHLQQMAVGEEKGACLDQEGAAVRRTRPHDRCAVGSCRPPDHLPQEAVYC